MIIDAKIKTRQKRFAVEKGPVWIISVKSPPEHGKANREIVKELSRLFGSARILSGAKSARKRIEIK